MSLDIWKDEKFGKWIFNGKSQDDDDLEKLDVQLEKLNQLYNQYHESAEQIPVYLPWKISEKTVNLETNYPELNLLYIGNKRFQDFLCHREFSYQRLEMLEEQISALQDKPECFTQYIWEKLTNFNVICIIAKFEMKLMDKKNLKEIDRFQKGFSEKWKHLFLQIRNMPNVLTKLIFLKLVFRYIEKALEVEREGLLHELKFFLAEVNAPYGMLQEDLLRLAANVRWSIDHNVNVQKWINELKKGYPLEDFEKWMFYLNIDDGCVYPNVSFGMPKKDFDKSFRPDLSLHNKLREFFLKIYLNMDSGRADPNVPFDTSVKGTYGFFLPDLSLRNKLSEFFLKNRLPEIQRRYGCQANEVIAKMRAEESIKNIWNFLLKCDLLEGMEKIEDEKNKENKEDKEDKEAHKIYRGAYMDTVSKALQKEGYITAAAKIEDEEIAEAETPIETICVGVITEKDVEKIQDLHDTEENIKEAIKLWPLSSNYKIVFENTLGQTKEFRKMCNFLLYHFWD